MGLRQIIIPLQPEFGLNRHIQILNIHIYIDKQLVDVSYAIVWTYEGTEVKREKHSFTLDNEGEFKYLDYWDTQTGNIIEAGIIEWFNNRPQ